MKLTEQQIRATVQRVYTESPFANTRKVAPVILKRALAGDQNILFVLHTHYQRHLHGTTAADAVKAWAKSVSVEA
jgi:hypothetical protein